MSVRMEDEKWKRRYAIRKFTEFVVGLLASQSRNVAFGELDHENQSVPRMVTREAMVPAI